MQKFILFIGCFLCILTNSVLCADITTAQPIQNQSSEHEILYTVEPADIESEISEIAELVEKEKITITLPATPGTSNSPYMGVYLSDLDFEDAYEFHYNYNYGVRLSGVVKNSPADRAGLQKDDIIMEFAGQKSRYKKILQKLIDSKTPNDEIEIKFFRYEQIMTTTLTLGNRADFYKPSGASITNGKAKSPKKSFSVGYGGGTWLPTWYTPELDDINSLFTQFNFKPLKDDGLFMNGFAFKGNIGKGFFMGGVGSWYETTDHIKHQMIFPDATAPDTARIDRKNRFEVGYGGITLDKRMAFSRNLISSIGFMLGWGETKITIYQYYNNIDDSHLNWNDLNNQLDNTYGGKLSLTRNSIIFQPKAMLMYRILDWLSIRAELGYMINYSIDGWQAKLNRHSIQIQNDPDTTMNGFTFSIGPWFGF